MEKKQEKQEKKPETNLDRIAGGLGVEAIDAAYLWNTQLSTKKKREEAAKKLHMFVSPCFFCERFHDMKYNGEIEHDCPHWKLPLDNCRKSTLKWLEEKA